MKLDTTDWAILRELQEDARLSYAEIGRRVGLSSPAVQERVRRLEEGNVIKAYRAEVNHKALGMPIMAITRVMNIQGKEKINLVRQISQSLPQVIRCYHVTGEDEYIVHIVAESIEGLEDVLHQYSDYAKLITSIVINAPVEHRSIDLEQFPNLKDLET